MRPLWQLLFLFQLRQEYGYDVDPRQPQFAEKIAEKEKEYIKKEKEEKKRLRAEKLKKFKEQQEENSK